MEEYWTSQEKYYSIFKISEEWENYEKFITETQEKQVFKDQEAEFLCSG